MEFFTFKPGLLEGHCIRLILIIWHKRRKKHGYHPEIILAGRRLNDSMGEYVAAQSSKTNLSNAMLLEGKIIKW